MKTTSLIAVLFLLSFSHVNAQIPPPDSYETNTDLDKFVGHWQWVSGSDTFRIFLQKQRVSFSNPHGYDVDMIVGWHKLVKNGLLVETSLQHIGKPYNTHNYVW